MYLEAVKYNVYRKYKRKKHPEQDYVVDLNKCTWNYPSSQLPPLDEQIDFAGGEDLEWVDNFQPDPKVARLVKSLSGGSRSVASASAKKQEARPTPPAENAKSTVNPTASKTTSPLTPSPTDLELAKNSVKSTADTKEKIESDSSSSTGSEDDSSNEAKTSPAINDIALQVNEDPTSPAINKIEGKKTEKTTGDGTRVQPSENNKEIPMETDGKPEARRSTRQQRGTPGPSNQNDTPDTGETRERTPPPRPPPRRTLASPTNNPAAPKKLKTDSSAANKREGQKS